MRKSIPTATLLIFYGLALPAQDNNGPRGEFAAVPAVVPIDKLPEFDVADIRASKDSGGPNVRIQPGGRLEFHSLPLKFAILAAWGFENDESRVTGGPSWINSEKFDVVAKAAHDAPVLQLRLMLRALLIKRFGLEMHIEDQLFPVYTLEKGKSSPKLTASTKDGMPECGRSLDDKDKDRLMISQACHNMTMDELANALRGMAPAYIDKPVVNLTGLNGQFDFKFGWTPRGQLLGTAGAVRHEGGILETSDPTAGGLTIFEAVDKHLGLKLNSAKHAIPIIVIDKINRTPTDN